MRGLWLRGRENKAWDAIEANGVKAIDVDPSRQAVKSMLDEIPEDATQLSGQEADIYQKILAWPKVRDFRNFQAVRSDLLAAMAQERATNGISPAYRRMAQVEQGMFNNIGSQAMAAEAAAPRPGGNSFAPVSAPTAGDYAYTPAGRKVGVRYEIVEGNSLVPSHDENLRPNPNFPPVSPAARSHPRCQRNADYRDGSESPAGAKSALHAALLVCPQPEGRLN